MNDNIILDVRDLRVHFPFEKKVIKAVDGVSFQVKKGKTLGIVGESGCGKSVTAHSIIQLTAQSAHMRQGEVDFLDRSGRIVTLSKLKKGSREMRAVRGKEISMVFQNPLASLNPVHKVGEQVIENLLQHEKMPKKEAKARVIEMFEALGIPDPAERFHDYPHQFSGGMKQRVMIAIAMICNPRLLIADEPTTALDVTIQAQIMELMKKLQKSFNTSMILITHNMGLVADMADDIAVMYMGKIVETGAKLQVLNNPKHPYTKALMRSVPVLGMGKKKRLEPIRGATPDHLNMHEGCAFLPRCDDCGQMCGEQPASVQVEDGHWVSCWRMEGSHE